jgi:hypothetical protein
MCRIIELFFPQTMRRETRQRPSILHCGIAAICITPAFARLKALHLHGYPYGTDAAPSLFS